MANTIRIKRRAAGGAAGAPASLANAELAFNEQDNILYYGWGTGGAGGTATQALAIGGPGAFQAVDADLTAIAALSTTGLAVRTAANTWALRSITAPAAGITITNGDGVSGNPTLALANDLAALEGLSTTGLIARTADGAATTRTITGTVGIVTVSNGNGVSGNPTIDLETVGVVVGGSTSTTSLVQSLGVDGYGRVTGYNTILLSNISLDQFKVPQANLSINSKRLTNVADPVNPQDAATKAYVDAARSGLDVKQSCRVASTGDITFGAGNEITIGGAPLVVDGITLVAGDRVLVKNQTQATFNGIWEVTTPGTGSNGSWTRPSDFSDGTNITPGAFTFVTEGTVNADSGWVLTTDGIILLGTTNLNFAQFSGAGQITAGAGMTKTGNTLDVVGTANRITVNADSIDIASTYVGQASITTLGTIGTGVWQGTVVAPAYGGTGLSSYTVGDLIYASGATTLAKLADVATGNALLSGGVGVAPSWGKIGLTTHVSGTLPIANGGTNSTATPTNGGVSYGTGSAFAFTAAGTAGQALVSAGAAAPVWATLTLENLPDAWAKRSVKAATTANITLSGTQTVDGIALVAGDRVLVKNQTNPQENGIYVVAAGAWARSADADVASELASAEVAVDQGTVNGGERFGNTFKTTDTVGTTSCTWYRILDSGDISSTVQAYDATLAALAGMSWSAGAQVVTLTAADTITLRTVGSAAGNILDKAAGDALYQPLATRLTNLAGVSWSSGIVIPALTSATAVTGKPVSTWAIDTFMTSADAATARSALGCLSMSTQASTNVSITGGSIDGITFDGGTF